MKSELPKIFSTFVFTYVACVLIFGPSNESNGTETMHETFEQSCQRPDKILFVRLKKFSTSSATTTAISKILLKTETPSSKSFSFLAGDDDRDTLVVDLDSLHPWNYAKVMNLLGPRAVIVTILSDPVDQFIDTLDRSSLKLDIKGLVKLIQSKRFKEKQLNIKKEMQEFRQTIGWKNGNSMIHELGFPSLFSDTDALDVDEYIAQLDRQMDLVLMMDRLEESVALLRRQLCWSEEELLSIIRDLGVHLYQPRMSRHKIEKEERDQLRKWLGSADDQLYTHFSEIFNRKVAGYPNLDEEIQRIRRTQYSSH